MSESIKVIARCRPLLPHESQSSFQCIKVNPSLNEIIITKGPDSLPDENKSFCFDEVIDPNSTQQSVYESGAFQLIESLMEGYNGTIFAYGQTSSGKTFTMMGVPEDSDLKGIIPRCFDHIMNIILAASEMKYMVRCSFIEIYNEEIFDLLKMEKNRPKLELRHSPSTGFFIKDMTQILVNSREEMMKVLRIGNKNKKMGETAMNANSSRSHTLMIVNVESVESLENSDKMRITQSKLNLVDLAGSERVGKSGIKNDVSMKECTKINLSLSALGNVISALVEGKSGHIPYRDSKLTRILQDSLGGNTKTVMVAAFSPSFSNYNETLGTLRYAARAKMIKNKPKINEDPKDALIRKYMEEIKRLKEALAKGGGEEFQNDIHNINHILEENRVLQLSRDQLAEELKYKDDFMGEKENNQGDMEKLVKSLQSNLVGGKAGNEEEIKKLDLARKKIRQQKKLHAQIVAQAKKKEEDLLAQVTTLQTKNVELEALQISNSSLFHKYKNALYEIEDLKREHEYEKESLLDSVRDQQKEVEFFEEILNNVLSPEEINKIRSHTVWSENLNKYKIPPFLFKEKTIKFPHLTYSQSQGLNNQQKQMRELEINCGLIEENSEESDWDSESNYETKQTQSLSTKKNVGLKLNVKPVKEENKNKKESQAFPKLYERNNKNFISQKMMEDDDPLTTPLEKKKNFLRTIDTVISSYTKKYSKDQIILPQNYSVLNSISFTDFKDLEKDIDIQTIKAKKNLNSLLDPLPDARNEEIMKEIIEEDVKPLKTPFGKHPLPSVGKFQIKSPFINRKSPFGKGKAWNLPIIEKKPLIVLKK